MKIPHISQVYSWWWAQFFIKWQVLFQRWWSVYDDVRRSTMAVDVRLSPPLLLGRRACVRRRTATAADVASPPRVPVDGRPPALTGSGGGVGVPGVDVELASW